MKLAKELLLFAAANLLGFYGAPLAYHASILTGLVPSMEKLVGTGLMPDHFFRNTMLVWIGCLVLSFAYFFFKQKGRSLILLIPALLPFAYGLSVLVRLSSTL